ncbi:MAG: flavodoxin domain-containing protein [Caldilineaceae bacterium]|nr:flavodoxin domain-containing protein [Caldilineaceae bacterium]
MNGSTSINRRRFLMIAGGAIGASALMCGGVTILTNQTPGVNYIYASCGKENTMQTVLVAYASKYGSTGEVAHAIADQFCARGMRADVRRVEEVTDLSAYDAVVIGSAIRMGRWLPQALSFVEKHVGRLQQMPTAIFTVHMLNADESEASRQARAAYVQPVHALFTPQSEAFFTGKMDIGNLNFMDRLIAKMVKAEDADLRDWRSIQAWADQLALA